MLARAIPSAGPQRWELAGIVWVRGWPVLSPPASAVARSATVEYAVERAARATSGRAEAVQRRLAEQHLLLRIEAGVAAEGQIPTEHEFQQLAATTQQLVAQ